MEQNQNNRSVEEQRRRRAENFRMNVSGGYDSDNPSDREPQEINSYSGQDVKEQIARESKKSLKKREREQKKALRARNKHNRRIFRIMWLVSVFLVGVMVATYIVTGMNDLLAINRSDNSSVSVPALSSAPRSVVPSVTIRRLPL